MKLPITIEYNSGEQATYIAQPPEWAKWEKQTGNTIGQASEKLYRDWETDRKSTRLNSSHRL